LILWYAAGSSCCYSSNDVFLDIENDYQIHIIMEMAITF